MTEMKRKMPNSGWATTFAGVALLALGACVPTTVATPPTVPAGDNGTDPRVGLDVGWRDAGMASWNMDHIAHMNRPAGFFNPNDPGDFAFANTDMAFKDNYAFVGSYHGFNVYDISDPATPELAVSVVCPGGQGDLSVFGDLLFMSVQESSARVDCGTQGVDAEISPERFRGVRIFDISDLSNPQQIAAVQTCRGSHTHTLVTDPDDDDNLYVYVSGTSVARSGEELAGCDPTRSPDDPNTSYWSIAIIQVPLGSPEDARVVNEPRVFADLETGEIAGLWPGGAHGPGTQETSMTNQCHDITAYPAIGLAAGACSGNGILLDISDPINPVRIDAVTDPNFAYWHSATFNNDGTVVVFTDEWGGGTAPRCQASDAPEWGADAIFRIVDRELVFASYYKMPAPQTAAENCVAHNGSLVPVPGRDIMVQAWYQGGISVFDFTDPENPYEIAYFDRGPITEDLTLAGFWSAYWYNGAIYGSEIGRGFDVFKLRPSQFLSQEDLEAARSVEYDQFNPQLQPKVTW